MAKNIVHFTVKQYKNEKNKNDGIDEHSERDKELSIVKEEMLHLSDRFDLLIFSLIK